MIEIDKLIAETIKTKKHEELEVYRAIKSEILNYKTAKNAKPYNEVAEINILKKMCKQREDSCKMYSEANRDDLYQAEYNQLEIIKKFLPEPVTESQICSELDMFAKINNYFNSENKIEIPKKEMGNCIKFIKTKFPAADGKMVSTIVKNNVK